MRTGDTIVATASGRGASPRAIVRLSGDATGAAIASLIGQPCEPGARRVRVTIPSEDGVGSVSFPALLLFWRGPRSYTREDCAELLVPGNASLVERTTARLCACEGVRAAEPGEFTARAYLHGRLTLDQAEGVAALIASASESSRRAAERLLSGETGRAMRAWRDEITDLLALVEAGIDFTDQEDVVAISPGVLAGRIDALLAPMRDAVGPRGSRERSDALARVALVGPPNAGKSTLFNALLGRQRAAVSERAGTTRDALGERVCLGASGVELELIDLAGLDAALSRGAPVDALARTGALREIERADAIVLCDPAGWFERADWAPPGVMREGRPVIRVRTKADLPFAGASGSFLPVCALDGYNLDALRAAIADAAAHAGDDGESGLIPRHRRAVGACVDALSAVLAMVNEHDRSLGEPELIAERVRDALDALGDAVGGVTPDEVLGRVFSSFCVGK